MSVPGPGLSVLDGLLLLPSWVSGQDVGGQGSEVGQPIPISEWHIQAGLKPPCLTPAITEQVRLVARLLTAWREILLNSTFLELTLNQPDWAQSELNLRHCHGSESYFRHISLSFSLQALLELLQPSVVVYKILLCVAFFKSHFPMTAFSQHVSCDLHAELRCSVCGLQPL